MFEAMYPVLSCWSFRIPSLSVTARDDEQSARYIKVSQIISNDRLKDIEIYSPFADVLLHC